MDDTQQYSLDSLVKVVDDWARRHRIKREAANEVGMALEKVCDHYEARLRGLEANRAMWDDEAIVNAMEADAYFDGKDSGYGEGIWAIASEDAVSIARQIRDDYEARLAETERELGVLKAQMAAQSEWLYRGDATVDVYGGGLIAMRMDGPFPQGPPQRGRWNMAFLLHKRID